MNTLYFGGPVDGGTFPADIWGDYMGRIKGGFCGDFEPPETPFVSSPFYGKYSKSGGSLTGGRSDDPDSTRRPRRPGRAGARGGVRARAGRRLRARRRATRTAAASTRRSTSPRRRARPRPSRRPTRATAAASVAPG